MAPAGDECARLKKAIGFGYESARAISVGFMDNI